jgi:hypothetical protein
MKKCMSLMLAAVLLGSSCKTRADWKSLIAFGTAWAGIHAGALYLHYKHGEKNTAKQLSIEEPFSETVVNGLVTAFLGASTQILSGLMLAGWAGEAETLFPLSAKATTLTAALIQDLPKIIATYMRLYQFYGMPIASGLAQVYGKGEKSLVNKEFAMGTGITAAASYAYLTYLRSKLMEVLRTSHWLVVEDSSGKIFVW